MATKSKKAKGGTAVDRLQTPADVAKIIEGYRACKYTSAAVSARGHVVDAAAASGLGVPLVATTFSREEANLIIAEVEAALGRSVRVAS